MLLSEIIKAMEEIKDKHGDMLVFVMGGYDYDERYLLTLSESDVKTASDPVNIDWSRNSRPKPEGYSDTAYLNDGRNKRIFVPPGHKYLQL